MCRREIRGGTFVNTCMPGWSCRGMQPPTGNINTQMLIRGWSTIVTERGVGALPSGAQSSTDSAIMTKLSIDNSSSRSLWACQSNWRMWRKGWGKRGRGGVLVAHALEHFQNVMQHGFHPLLRLWSAVCEEHLKLGRRRDELLQHVVSSTRPTAAAGELLARQRGGDSSCNYNRENFYRQFMRITRLPSTECCNMRKCARTATLHFEPWLQSAGMCPGVC